LEYFLSCIFEISTGHHDLILTFAQEPANRVLYTILSVLVQFHLSKLLGTTVSQRFKKTKTNVVVTLV